MMKGEDIKWEEAPEGATHYNLGNDMWYKFEQNGFGCLFTSAGNWSGAAGMPYSYTHLVERPKEKEMQFKAMKIRVKDEEHSRLIQEALFEMGYEWASSVGRGYEFLRSPYLYTSNYGGIYYGESDYSFNQDVRQEYEAKIKVEFVEIQKPDTVELNGKIYLKSDLEEALAKLNPVEE